MLVVEGDVDLLARLDVAGEPIAVACSRVGAMSGRDACHRSGRREHVQV
jgi:hypothetical protein